MTSVVTDVETVSSVVTDYQEAGAITIGYVSSLSET